MHNIKINDIILYSNSRGCYLMRIWYVCSTWNVTKCILLHTLPQYGFPLKYHYKYFIFYNTITITKYWIDNVDIQVIFFDYRECVMKYNGKIFYENNIVVNIIFMYMHSVFGRELEKQQNCDISDCYAHYWVVIRIINWNIVTQFLGSF